MAGYCKDCDCYYILDTEFKRLKSIGMVLCRIIEHPNQKSSKSDGFYGNLSPESKLKQLGYNVSETTGPTDNQRIMLLSCPQCWIYPSGEDCIYVKCGKYTRAQRRKLEFNCN